MGSLSAIERLIEGKYVGWVSSSCLERGHARFQVGSHSQYHSLGDWCCHLLVAQHAPSILVVHLLPSSHSTIAVVILPTRESLDGKPPRVVSAIQNDAPIINESPVVSNELHGNFLHSSVVLAALILVAITSGQIDLFAASFGFFVARFTVVIAPLVIELAIVVVTPIVQV